MLLLHQRNLPFTSKLNPMRRKRRPQISQTYISESESAPCPENVLNPTNRIGAHKHLFVDNLKFRARAQQNQDFTGASSGRFLGKERTARCAVPLDIPKEWQISAQERPSLRRTPTLRPSTWTRGLPSRFPRDFAKTNPDLTRSRISSRSNSAIDAKMPNTSLPFGVEVSTPSCKLTKSIPSARNSSSAFTSWRS